MFPNTCLEEQRKELSMFLQTWQSHLIIPSSLPPSSPVGHQEYKAHLSCSYSVPVCTSTASAQGRASLLPSESIPHKQPRRFYKICFCHSLIKPLHCPQFKVHIPSMAHRALCDLSPACLSCCFSVLIPYILSPSHFPNVSFSL